MIKKLSLSVFFCAVTACAGGESQPVVEANTSYPVIEAMVEVPRGNFWMLICGQALSG